jgi:hypothetical protein
VTGGPLAGREGSPEGEYICSLRYSRSYSMYSYVHKVTANFHTAKFQEVMERETKSKHKIEQGIHHNLCPFSSIKVFVYKNLTNRDLLRGIFFLELGHIL